MSTYLSLHLDEFLPPIPYIAGQHFQATEHRPDPPPEYPDYLRIAVTEQRFYDQKRSLHPWDVCQRHPPSVGTSHPENRIDLLVTGTLETGHKRSSQTVRAISTIEGRRVELVAKFYDPLYWDFGAGGVNMFSACDKNYRHEAHAYRQLHNLYGSIVPRFYGSYTVDILPPGFGRHTQTRQVRLTLTEYISGHSLAALDPRTITKPLRQEIMAKVAYAETMLQVHDVLHGDVYPRNFILHVHEGNTSVFILDLADAYVGAFGQSRIVRTVRSRADLTNEINRTWMGQHYPSRFEGWAHGWNWDTWLRTIVSRYNLGVRIA